MTGHCGSIELRSWRTLLLNPLPVHTHLELVVVAVDNSKHARLTATVVIRVVIIVCVISVVTGWPEFLNKAVTIAIVAILLP